MSLPLSPLRINMSPAIILRLRALSLYFLPSPSPHVCCFSILYYAVAHHPSSSFNPAPLMSVIRDDMLINSSVRSHL